MSVRSSVEVATTGQTGPLVSIALALATRLDDPDEKSPASVAKELRATLDQLGEVAAKEVPSDPLAAARAARTARKAAASRL
jgi:hypothetical protein